MTLTPEQFNQLVTKTEFNELKSDVNDIKDGVKQLLTAIDGLANKIDKQEIEFTSNIAAHDRFEEKIAKIETQLKPKPAF
jgi:peptidoglycan hydrolase CwlO-like protein